MVSNIENRTKSSSGKNRSKAAKHNISWLEQIRNLESYCAEKGWMVKYVAKTPGADSAWPDSNRIIIQKDRKSEVTFYYFLHELGHMLICQNKNSYSDKYSAIYDDFHANSQTHKVVRIEEELEAWKVGYKLARRLKLSVNRRNFEQIKSRCIMTYFTWAVKRKIKDAISEMLKDEGIPANERNNNKQKTVTTDERFDVISPRKRNPNRKYLK